MRVSFPLIFAAVSILVLGVVELLLLRFFNPSWWRIRWVKRVGMALPLLGAIAVVLWGLGQYYAIGWLTKPSQWFVMSAFILLMALMLSLPISGLIHFAHWVVDKVRARRNEPDELPDRRRRMLFKAAAAAVPTVTLGMAAGGVARAFAGVSMPRREVVIQGLPESLDGIRILQLSDLHLRHYVTLDDLEDVVRDAEAMKPDLVLVTGDIADDLEMLPGAIELIQGMRAPLGTFACLGNHEYFRGVDAVRRIFDRSPIPLFINQGVRIPVNGDSLYIAGIDDPRSMGAKDLAFYERTIDIALAGAGSQDTIVLMSHRPDAFDYAATQGVELTLSGHTHGGQIGFMGRSVFEPVWPDRYLWGHYDRSGSQLYTTSGMGHWFPFRLGCPQEVPLLVLRRG